MIKEARGRNGQRLGAVLIYTGEAHQFSWTHEIVQIQGATTTLKVAHVQLCYSRMMFARAHKGSAFRAD
jgi:hypothetical protein